MRPRSILSAAAALAACSLLAAAPAHAEVLTTTEVTDVVVVHATAETFSYGVYTPWEPEGPAVFPSTVASGAGGSYVLQGYRPVLPVLAEGCTRTIDAFSVSYRALIDDVGASETSFYIGAPADFVPSTVEFDGAGTIEARPDFTSIAPVDGDNSGTVTFTLDEAVSDDTTLFGFIGFFTDEGVLGDPLYSVDEVSFTTSTTCPDPVVVPAAAPELADTGIDSATAIVAGGTAVALVALGFTLLIARRRPAFRE